MVEGIVEVIFILVGAFIALALSGLLCYAFIRPFKRWFDDDFNRDWDPILRPGGKQAKK